MKKNVLLIGAGGVAHAAAHKLAQNNDVFGKIYIASRTMSACTAILESIERKGNYKDPFNKITARTIDAMDIPALIKLIKELDVKIVINLASTFCNMSILDACIKTGAAFIDTAIHEDPEKVCENPPWYANYEWKRKEICAERGITAVLSAGFDPGVVNAYVAYAQKHLFDTIDTIDIMDVNAGHHGKYFATNFDPEVNFREFHKVWTYEDRKWVEKPCHTEKINYDFPVVGEQTVYLTGHDEIHSLYKNIDANSIRFWMGFSEHYLNVFGVLKNLGLLSEKPVTTSEGVEVVPIKVVKAVLPDPKTLAVNYTGKTCIGVLVLGKKGNREKEIFIYNVCDHQKCFEEVESQAISYTGGVPAVAAAILVARGDWDCKKMVNVEELDPDPYLNLLEKMGLPTKIVEK